MKTHINLLKVQKRKDFLTLYASRMLKLMTALGVAFFILFVALIVKNTQEEIIYSQLLKKKEQQLKLLILDKDTEAKIRFFKGKQGQLKLFLADDAQFVPYYTVLQDSLNQSSNSGDLDSVIIDKTRSTQFIVKFQKHEDMLAFLKYVESESFLKNFINLSLMSFNLNADLVTDKKYELTMKGVFRELKQNNNEK